MKRSLTDWRRAGERRGEAHGAGRRLCVFAAALAGALTAGGGVPCSVTWAAPAAAVAPADADPGVKLLLKASGFFENKRYDWAAEQYEAFLKGFPSHPEAANARYALALCYYNQNDYPKAVAQLEQVLKAPKFEQRDEALAVLGHAELSAGHFGRSLAAFDELLDKYPKSKQAEAAALNRAQVLYLDKKYPQAAVAADSFLKQYPKADERPAALYFLGLSQNAQDQNDKAAATLGELLDKHPKNRFEVDATLVLGQALEAQGKLDAAADQYRRMLAAAPAARQADGHYSLGVVLSRAGKYDEAAKELAAVVAGAPEGPYAKAARLQLGLVQLAGGKTADARKTLSIVAKDDPANAAAARYGLAQADIADRKYDAALITLEELLKATPPPANAAQVALDRAVCLSELGRHKDAAQEFAAFVASNPTSPQAAEAQYRQAYSLHRLDQYAESHALAQKVAAGKGEFARPAAELDAENLFLARDYAAAAKAYADLSATATDPAKKDLATFRLGQCAYFSNDYAKAIQLLQPLAATPRTAGDETLGRAVFLLGDALLQQKQYAEAATALQKYVASPAKGDKAEAQFKLALAQLRSDQQAAAEKNLAAVAAGPADSPWVPRALLELGQLAYNATPPQAEKAAGYLKRVLDANGGNPPAELAAPSLYLLGWIDFNAKRYADAAEKWGQVVAKYPKDATAADAAYQRGVALREAGKNDEALTALQAYVKDYPEGPNVAKAKQVMAAALTSLNRTDEAKQMLVQLAAGKAGAGDTVLYDLAWAQKQTNDKAAAADTYRRLIKEQPESKLLPAARTELAEILYGDKKYDEATSLLEQAVASKEIDTKKLTEANYLLGWCNARLGKHEPAAEAFARSASVAAAASLIDPERTPSALLQAGIEYAAAERYERAVKPLQEMLQKFPQNKDAAVAQLKLGEALADSGDYAGSLKTNTEFLTRFPNNEFGYRAQFGIGWALENQKKYPEAREAYKKVTDSPAGGETAARAQFQVGETLLAEGKPEQAAKELLSVEYVYAYPKWSARALLEAGKAFEQLKQMDQAKQQYARVVEKYKDTPEAGLAQDRLKTIKG